MQAARGERAGAARAGGRALQQEAVVGAAQQLVLPQGELVAGQQLAAAHGAAEALDVVHAVPRPHHQVAAAEAHLALGALDAEQPVRAGQGVSARPRARPRGSAAIPQRRPRRAGGSPDVVPLAVGLPVSHEARARLVQVLAALGALEAGGVPLEVWRHPQDELVVDLTPAAHARGGARLLCGEECSESGQTAPAAPAGAAPPRSRERTV